MFFFLFALVSTANLSNDINILNLGQLFKDLGI